MKLAERVVALVLDDRGREAMRLAGIQIEEGSPAQFQIEETTDVEGIWARVPREDGESLCTHPLGVYFDYRRTRRRN